MPTRRTLLAAGVAAVAATAIRADEKKPDPKPTFKFCLNTSTIRQSQGDWGKPRPITESIDIAAKAGYTAIEPWIQELDEYVKGGGTLKDLGKKFADAGLAVPDAIGFAEWLVSDDDRRKKGLENAKRDMDKVLAVGGKCIAAPPVGATAGGSRRDDPKFTEPVSAVVAAERYRALLDVGKAVGVTPLVEVWGHSASLGKLGETLLAAMECGTDGGAVLPDVYHLYKGGSGFGGLKLVSSAAIGIFHVNDYPRIERGKIVDQDRVYPGDGVAPLKDVFATLRQIGYAGFLSLELFNREYWKQDPLEVAATGLRKLKAALAG
jgi:sugar phosphate isomerase/epimerase